MTLEECRENHKKLWNWIADETRKRGVKILKEDYFEEHPDLPIPKNNCYLCEYAKQFPHYHIICINCPIFNTKEECGNVDSSYRKWVRYANTPKKCADLAELIANIEF